MALLFPVLLGCKAFDVEMKGGKREEVFKRNNRITLGRKYILDS